MRLRGVGLNETYVPDCDLEKARQLLLSLYALRAENGRCLKENFHHQGFNWLSGLVNTCGGAFRIAWCNTNR